MTRDRVLPRLDHVLIGDLSPSLGRELRRWRGLRALSQLALATRSGVSTRHISFIETGRSRPTAEMILRLAEVLEVPLADRNRLLLAGGFAPKYAHGAIGAGELAPILSGLRDLLDGHEPYPALLLDDDWNVIDQNRAVDALLRGCAAELLEPPVNVIRVSLHPRGLAPRIHNLGRWRGHLLHQLDERIGRSGNRPSLVALREEVSGYPVDGQLEAAVPVDPILPLELTAPGGELIRMFSVTSRLEGPADVTLSGLHLETFVPADAATRTLLTR